MRGIAKIGCGLLLLAAIAGCSRSVDTVQVGDSLGNEYKWIQTDAGIGKTAKVVSAKKTRTDTGLLKVQVELYSVRHNDAKFVYKFVWLDAKGMEINSITNDWQVRVINGHETLMITGTAGDPRVTDCRLKLQDNIR